MRYIATAELQWHCYPHPYSAKLMKNGLRQVVYLRGFQAVSCVLGVVEQGVPGHVNIDRR